MKHLKTFENYDIKEIKKFCVWHEYDHDDAKNIIKIKV